MFKNNYSINQNFFEKILIYLIIFFPLIIILRSTTLNIAALLICFFTIFLLIKKNLYSFVNNTLIKWILFFLIFIIINSLINFYSFEIFFKSIGNLRYLLISIGVVMALNLMTKEQKKILINFNLILISFVALDIIYQFFSYKNIFGFLPGMCNKGIEQGCQRFSGVFNDELVGGAYIAQLGLLFIFISKIKLFEHGSRFFKFKNLFLLLFFTAIIISGERNALIIFLLSISFLLIFQKKFLKLLLIFLFVGSSIFLISIFSSEVKNRYFDKFLNLKTIPISNYFNVVINSPWGYHYQAATELFLKKPVLGNGYKSYRRVCINTEIEKKIYTDADEKPPYSACSTHPHNYLFEMLSENGLIGGFFYLGIIFILLNQLYKNMDKKLDVNKKVLVGLCSLILAILFPLKPSGSFFSTFNAAILFYILGYYIDFVNKVLFRKSL